MGWLFRRRRADAAAAPSPEPLELPSSRRRPRQPPERLTTLNISEFLAAHPRAVVDVWASWCGPCRAFGPVFEAASAEWGERVGFGKLNADHEPSLVRGFGVRSIPTLLYFRDGRLVRRGVGAASAERFRDQIRLAFRDLR